MVKKKNIRKSALLLIMIMLATGITACGTEEEPLPDLSAMGAVTWNAFGMDKEGADFRACKNYGPLYK